MNRTPTKRIQPTFFNKQKDPLEKKLPSDSRRRRLIPPPLLQPRSPRRSRRLTWAHALKTSPRRRRRSTRPHALITHTPRRYIHQLRLAGFPVALSGRIAIRPLRRIHPDVPPVRNVEQRQILGTSLSIRYLSPDMLHRDRWDGGRGVVDGGSRLWWLVANAAVWVGRGRYDAARLRCRRPMGVAGGLLRCAMRCLVVYGVKLLRRYDLCRFG